MARTGNHGIIIPRDKELLTRLYWTEERTLTEMGAMFGVNQRSVSNAMRVLGIPTRAKSSSPHQNVCRDCRAKPVFKLPHPLTKKGTGRRCRDCQSAHRKLIAQRYQMSEHGKANRRKHYTRWYNEGPLNPNGELQWITKGKHLLRTAQRALLRPSRDVCKSLGPASAPGQTLRT